MTRLLTGRLDKLVAKKDDACAQSLFLLLISEFMCLQWKRTIKRLYGATQQKDLGHLLQNDNPPDEL
jgi:hypothetical protein